MCTPDLLQSETRTYRFVLSAGQCLHATVTPTDGASDPDLYVWSPTGTLLAFSNQGAGVKEEVEGSAEVDNAYQLEIHGYTAGAFTLAVKLLPSSSPT